MSKPGDIWTRLKGKVTRPIANAAGDRQAEAKADVQARTGNEPNDATVDAREQAVRRQHGDIQTS